MDSLNTSLPSFFPLSFFLCFLGLLLPSEKHSCYANVWCIYLVNREGLKAEVYEDRISGIIGESLEFIIRSLFQVPSEDCWNSCQGCLDCLEIGCHWGFFFALSCFLGNRLVMQQLKSTVSLEMLVWAGGKPLVMAAVNTKLDQSFHFSPHKCIIGKDPRNTRRALQYNCWQNHQCGKCSLRFLKQFPFAHTTNRES